MNKISLTSIILIIVLLLVSLDIFPQAVLAQTQLPDLTIVNAWQTGNQIQYIVKNNGLGAISGVGAPVSFYNALFVDGKLVAQDHVTVSLAAGQQLERVFNYQYQATPPSNAIRVIADYQQNIQEVDEQNNIWETVWQVTENLPDLTVEKLEVGEGNKLSVTIKNIGTGPLTAGWSALGQIWINGQDKGTFTLQNPTFNIDGGIATGGGSATYLLPWDILEPTLVACAVDITSSINESNEQNNYLEEKIVPPTINLPDIVIAGIEYDQKTGNVSCIIKNIDAGDTSTSFICSLSLSDPFVYEESAVQATLKGGETFTLYFKSSVQPLEQTVTIQVCADILNQIKESNEENNCLEKTYTVEVTPPTTPPPTEKPPTPLTITSSPTVSKITQTSAVVCWSTNEASDSLVKYNSSSGKFDVAVEDQNRLQEHCLNLDMLKPATTYCFVVESKDASGNKVASRVLSFETLSPADKKKPSSSLLLPTTVSGRVLITADARDNIGVDRVIFLLDGKEMYTDYTAPFEWEFDTSGIEDGTHSFGARTIDSAGNVEEVIRDGDARNRFPLSETPVTVTITNPVSRSEVYGIVEIRAAVAQEKGGEIVHTEVRIDGVTVQQSDISPLKISPFTTGRRPELGKSIIVRYLWDTRRLVGGREYVIEVLARDEFGNDGQHGIVVTKIAEPEVPFSIERTVTRNENYFHVEVTVRNMGTGDDYNAINLMIRDKSRGFQVAAFERTPLYDWTRSEVTVEKWEAALSAGETTSFSYNIVPVLLDPMLDDYTVGISTTIEYEDAFMRRQTQDYTSPYIPGDYICYPYPLLPREIGNALLATDYLIITDPELLFRYSDATDVNDLLSAMAELAVCKNGVLAYRRPGASWTTAQVLKNNFELDGIWSSRLSLESALNGYILLVGETEIIPSWHLPCPGFFTDNTGGYIDISDYPYADISGDERPELRVGRIIGENARELIEPIRASLGVYRGRAEYDGSDVLFVTGFEDTWEAAIKNTEDGRITVDRKGVNTPVPVVHTEYYTTEQNMLAEALRIKGTGNGGARFEADLSAYPVRQLAVWLLDSEDVRWAVWSMEYEHFTDSEGRQHQWAPGYVGDEEVQQALRIAERIQADRGGRGGDYGWTYTYCRTHEEALRRIADEVKAQTPNKDVIVFLGHGGAGSWGCVLDDWTTSECPIEPINYGRSCPIIIAFSCLTGNYVDEPGRSIARAFLRNGAAVYIGSTEVSSTGTNEEAVREAFWRSWTRSSRIGDAFCDFRDRKIREGSGWRYLVYEYNLYGDPKFGGD